MNWLGTIEPFELRGRTIEDCYYVRDNMAVMHLMLKFTDGSTAQVEVDCHTDEISGNEVPTFQVIFGGSDEERHTDLDNQNVTRHEKNWVWSLCWFGDGGPTHCSNNYRKILIIE